MALNFPINPADGDTYEGYVYDATAGVWNSDPHQIASRFVTSATAPSGASEGDGWFDTNTAKSYVYYDGVWVQLGALGTVDLNQIADVNVSSPANGEALIYDDTTSQWVNEVLPEPVLTFSGLDDTSTSTPQSGDSLVYDGSAWVNGPRSGNAIINGDFGIWQRGTSFNNGYTADRWNVSHGGYSINVTQETFSPGEVPVAGYGESQHYIRLAYSGTGTSTGRLEQHVEDVRTLAGQTVTLSFWAKASADTETSCNIFKNYGSGGSSIDGGDSQSYDITTSWQRISKTFDLNDMSGKTIGDNSFLYVQVVREGSGSRQDGISIDIWGVQLEAGSVATPFRLAGGGSKAAELALCQRYYSRDNAVDNYTAFATVSAQSTTTIRGSYRFPATMRTTPSVSFSGNFQAPGLDNGPFTPTMARLNINGGDIDIVATGQTFGKASTLRASNDTSAYIEIDAEL